LNAIAEAASATCEQVAASIALKEDFSGVIKKKVHLVFV
jgi:hypothetical protein